MNYNVARRYGGGMVVPVCVLYTDYAGAHQRIESAAGLGWRSGKDLMRADLPLCLDGVANGEDWLTGWS